MTRPIGPILALALAIGMATAGAAEQPARPRPGSHLCPEDAPEGVRLPPRPGCGTEARPPRGGRDIPALDGIDIRVGGRVGAEFGVRR